MDCEHLTPQAEGDFLQRFNRRLVRDRVPVSGSFALTHRCNLRCVHCYLEGTARTTPAADELATDRVLSLLDELAHLGCLFLVFTGGEPLLRADFPVIYRRAKLNGLIVIIFTNGTLVDDQLAELFRELPPTTVEISLYGATAATHDAITQVPGSFARSMGGIDRLRAAGVQLVLKTVMLQANLAEVAALEALASRLGARFRLDAAVFPRFDGDRAPLALRVPAEDAIARELADPRRVQLWRKYLAEREGLVLTDHLYQCGAGLTTFHIDAQGYLLPCLMNREPRYDLKQGDFLTGWRDVIARIRDRRLPESSPCYHCDRKLLCGYCPPFAILETGSAHGAPAYLCALARCRQQALATPGPD